MAYATRRLLLAAAGTLPAAALLRKGAVIGEARAETLLGMQALRPTEPPVPLTALRWTLPDGTVRTVADYAGQGIVLNCWATWCQPCVAEMPALARLAAALARDGVAVLPISSDRGGAAPVERFYRDRGIDALPVLLDPRGEAARALGARGIPTTLIVDRQGQERARLEGGADWGSPEALAAVRRLVGPAVVRDRPINL